MPTRRATLAGLAALAAMPARAAAERPVVAELFTSEGCSSCPPAEALLRDLAGQPAVLPLAFHITYWNGLGWRDPFSLDLATARQRAYQAMHRWNTIYTPQLVVDGRVDVVGSDRLAVARALRDAMERQVPGPEIALAEAEGAVSVRVGAGHGRGSVLLAGYDPLHVTPVGRGENAGRTLTEANIVRSLTVLAEWQGAEIALHRARPAGARLAALVQGPDGGYLAAATLPAGAASATQ